VFINPEEIECKFAFLKRGARYKDVAYIKKGSIKVRRLQKDFNTVS